MCWTLQQEEQVQAGGAGNSQAAAADSNNLWSVWDSQDLKAVELQTRLLGNCTDTTSFKALKAYLMHMRQQVGCNGVSRGSCMPELK